MKSLVNVAIFTCMLALAASCGNDNKSGRRNNDPYGYGAYGAYSAYTANGVQLGQVIAENPCIGSGAGPYVQGSNPYYNNNAWNTNFVASASQRVEVSFPLTNFTVIPNGDIYVGVTSYGDVAAVIGNGSTPMFVAYICPRSAASGQGSLRGISLGAYTNCAVKPLTAATMLFPDGTSADFRMADFGSSQRTKFSFCR